MPIYSYQALDTKGNTKKGTIDADTPRDARDKLRRQDLRVTEMDQVKAGRKQGGEKTGPKFSFERRVNLRELAIITRQFSTLLSSLLHAERLPVSLQQRGFHPIIGMSEPSP